MSLASWRASAQGVVFGLVDDAVSAVSLGISKAHAELNTAGQFGDLARMSKCAAHNRLFVVFNPHHIPNTIKRECDLAYNHKAGTAPFARQHRRPSLRVSGNTLRSTRPQGRYSDVEQGRAESGGGAWCDGWAGGADHGPSHSGIASKSALFMLIFLMDTSLTLESSAYSVCSCKCPKTSCHVATIKAQA